MVIPIRTFHWSNISPLDLNIHYDIIIIISITITIIIIIYANHFKFTLHFIIKDKICCDNINFLWIRQPSVVLQLTWSSCRVKEWIFIELNWHTPRISDILLGIYTNQSTFCIREKEQQWPRLSNHVFIPLHKVKSFSRMCDMPSLLETLREMNHKAWF